MPPASDRSPVSGRRIFSRLSSPFSTSRTRNVTEFSVNPDDEHRKYSPGDAVTGHVLLRVAKPIRITHLVICLHGFVQVYKQPGSPGEGTPVIARGKKSAEQAGSGFASLFEDEVVLCGDGRLAEGPYQFNFELLFPDRALPSSIEFERGIISYVITATLTRPNTISPVISCERKVSFVERIDIAPLYPPKARTITLTPLPKRSRAKHSTRRLGNISERNDTAESIHSDSNTLRQSDGSSERSGRAGSQTPASARQSVSSSAGASCNAPSLPYPESRSNGSPSPSDTGRSQDTKISSRTETSRSEKVVMVTMESQVGGCLQGDSIPVKVGIAHTKPVRSLYGVIVTLFRQARVDMRPAVPLGPVEKGKDVKSEEDYYPKSVTGLGGLSLSGAGSSHVFRKDLAQTIRPMYVDPNDLSAEVNARVHVPAEAFPTITTVPGSMISFRYYVEVIVDIQGKLQGQEKGLLNVSGQRVGAPQFGPEDASQAGAGMPPVGSTFIDTATVRRDKGVVSCTFEVVVGTKDSERKKGKRKVEALMPPPGMPPEPTAQAAPETAFATDPGAHEYASDYYYDPDWYGANYGYGYDDATQGQYYWHYPEMSYETPPPAPPTTLPLPSTPDESQMTEKERIRQAEIRLLPSQPPGAEAGPAEGSIVPTAPLLMDGSEELLVQTIAPGHSTEESYLTASGSRVRLDVGYEPRGAVPDYASHPLTRQIGNANGEQHDIERAEASLVPLEGAAESTAPEPSAPTLEEVEGPAGSMHDSHADAPVSSDLPRYER